MRVYMRNDRLQLNPGLPKAMPSLVLDGVVLPETDLMHNLVVFLDSQLLLKSSCG